MARRRGDDGDTTGEGSRPSGAKAVEIVAEVRQVKTMVDGTVNVTFNLPEYCLTQAQVLMGWTRAEVRAIIQIAGE